MSLKIRVCWLQVREHTVKTKRAPHLFLPVEMLYSRLKKESLRHIFILVSSDAVKPMALCRNRESHSGHSNPSSMVHLPFVLEKKNVSHLICCLQGWALLSSLCPFPEMCICSFLPPFAIKNTVIKEQFYSQDL